jgi:hypothetical protein
LAVAVYLQKVYSAYIDIHYRLINDAIYHLIVKMIVICLTAERKIKNIERTEINLKEETKLSHCIIGCNKSINMEDSLLHISIIFF